jgi:hypothetical protein
MSCLRSFFVMGTIICELVINILKDAARVAFFCMGSTVEEI